MIRRCSTAVIFAAAFLSAACMNQTVLNDGKPDPNAPVGTPRVKTIEDDLRAAKTAGYLFIYLVKRKDGGQIDYHDKLLLSSRTKNAARRSASEDGTAFTIAGNQPLTEEDIGALNTRFAVSILKQDAPGSNSAQNSNADPPK